VGSRLTEVASSLLTRPSRTGVSHRGSPRSRKLIEGLPLGAASGMQLRSVRAPRSHLRRSPPFEQEKGDDACCAYNADPPAPGRS